MTLCEELEKIAEELYEISCMDDAELAQLFGTTDTKEIMLSLQDRMADASIKLDYAYSTLERALNILG